MGFEVHKDIYPLSTGTQKGLGIGEQLIMTESGENLMTESGEYLATEDVGVAGGTISDPGQDFKSCGIQIGLAIRNLTDGSSGLVTAVTEDTVTCTLSGGTDNTFERGDVYAIYCTGTYNGTISTIYTGKRYGRKATDKYQLIHRLFPEEIDYDERDDNIFSTGQPKKEYMR